LASSFFVNISDGEINRPGGVVAAEIRQHSLVGREYQRSECCSWR
jgi:hypothetical protein